MKNRQIICPSRISYDELSKFLKVREFISDSYDCLIDCDCSALSFVDPMGLCVLKHWFCELKDRKVRINLINLPLPIESFLRRMDLLTDPEFVIFPDRTSLRKRRDMDGRLIELQRLDNQNDIGFAATRIAKTIVHNVPDISKNDDPDGMQPSVSEKMEDILQYVFSEILLNSLDHGRKRNYHNSFATVAAQYYSVTNFLEVAVLDNGCGLLETLKHHQLMEGDISDSKAISIARKPRVSCNRDASLGLDTRNQGVGLTVSANIALAANGRCGIFSGRSSHSFLPDDSENVTDIPYWQGTGVFFQFNKNQLSDVSKSTIIAALPGYRPVESIKFR